MNAMIVTAAALMLAAGSAQAGGYKTVAKEFARRAAREGVERVAVLPFTPTDASAPSDGWNVSERLITQLVRRGGVKVVERGLLGRLLEEQSLARTGLIDPGGLRKLGAILSVDAVVTGSFVTRGGEVEVNARLILVETGVIAAAAEATVPREWFDAAAGPELAAAPALEPAPSEPGCADAPQRLAALELSNLDQKARYWAGRLRQGLSAAELEGGPAAGIADPVLRERFLQLARGYLSGGRAGLAPAQIGRFVALEEQALTLRRECGI